MLDGWKIPNYARNISAAMQKLKDYAYAATQNMAAITPTWTGRSLQKRVGPSWYLDSMASPQPKQQRTTTNSPIIQVTPNLAGRSKRKRKAVSNQGICQQ
jgi:hypothetical protein